MPFGQAPGQGFNQPVNPAIVTQVIQVKGAYLYYSPSAGSGNLIQSSAPGQGTDKYGNMWLNGFVTYVNLIGNNWLAIQIDGNSVNLLESTTGPGGPYTVNGQLFGSTNAVALSAFNCLLSFSDTGFALLETPNGHINLLPGTGFNTITQNPIVAGAVGVPETWHPFSLMAGTAAGVDINGTTYTPAYALDAQGNLKVHGTLNCPAGGLASGTTFATVPAGYRPTTNIPVSLVSVAGHGTLVHLYVRPNGNMQFNGALGAGAVVYLDTTLLIQGT
jgi:hypothetical protein